MSPICRSKRDLCKCADLTREDVEAILEDAAELKREWEQGRLRPLLAGKALAMIFEKPSLRTRVTFELGMVHLGGHAINLMPSEIGLGQRESVHDVARNLERWCDMIIARTFAQNTVDELAHHARIPVINALSDLEHPCQALADLLTLREKFGENLAGFNLTYIGDGNNICHSLMQLGSLLGINVTVCTPTGYEPLHEIHIMAEEAARHNGAKLNMVGDPREAVARAGAVYTDVWASMGQEHEAEHRVRQFAPYQVNAELLAAAPAEVLVMHDLPAHRGEEITEEVLEGPSCICFDQAENRLHAQKGLMTFIDAATRH